MHRCFVDMALVEVGQVVLPVEESHHLVDVMRASSGDKVLAFDGRGGEADAVVVINDSRQKQVTLEVREIRQTQQPRVSITLIQALPKGKRFDLVVEKATELGVAEIWPVVSERVVKTHDGQKSLDRWNRIAVSAARQCGNNWVPEIRGVRGIREAVSEAGRFDLLLTGSLAEDAKPIKEVVLEVGCGKGPSNIAVLIGPEGDWTDEELVMFGDAGAVAVSFGRLVLRSETAAIFAASVLVHEFVNG